MFLHSNLGQIGQTTTILLLLGAERSGEKQAADGNQRCVGMIGRALIISHLDTFSPIQVAQHEVERGEAAYPVAIPDLPDLAKELGRVPPRDGIHEALILFSQALAARLIHLERIAKRGTNVGEID